MTASGGCLPNKLNVRSKSLGDLHAHIKKLKQNHQQQHHHHDFAREYATVRLFICLGDFRDLLSEKIRADIIGL